jgi:hypothetical protein
MLAQLLRKDGVKFSFGKFAPKLSASPFHGSASEILFLSIALASVRK